MSVDVSTRVQQNPIGDFWVFGPPTSSARAPTQRLTPLHQERYRNTTGHRHQPVELKLIFEQLLRCQYAIDPVHSVVFGCNEGHRVFGHVRNAFRLLNEGLDHVLAIANGPIVHVVFALHVFHILDGQARIAHVVDQNLVLLLKHQTRLAVEPICADHAIPLVAQEHVQWLL